MAGLADEVTVWLDVDDEPLPQAVTSIVNISPAAV
jgi:hypothetical protein